MIVKIIVIVKNCEMCKILVILQDFEKDLTANMYNDVFMETSQSTIASPLPNF